MFFMLHREPNQISSTDFLNLLQIDRQAHRQTDRQTNIQKQQPPELTEVTLRTYNNNNCSSTFLQFTDAFHVLLSSCMRANVIF